MQAMGKATERIKSSNTIQEEKSVEGMSGPYIYMIFTHIISTVYVADQHCTSEGSAPA